MHTAEIAATCKPAHLASAETRLGTLLFEGRPGAQAGCRMEVEAPVERRPLYR